MTGAIFITSVRSGKALVNIITGHSVAGETSIAVARVAPDVVRAGCSVRASVGTTLALVDIGASDTRSSETGVAVTRERPEAVGTSRMSRAVITAVITLVNVSAGAKGAVFHVTSVAVTFERAVCVDAI